MELVCGVCEAVRLSSVVLSWSRASPQVGGEVLPYMDEFKRLRVSVLSEGRTGSDIDMQVGDVSFIRERLGGGCFQDASWGGVLDLSYWEDNRGQKTQDRLEKLHLSTSLRAPQYSSCEGWRRWLGIWEIWDCKQPAALMSQI